MIEIFSAKSTLTRLKIFSLWQTAQKKSSGYLLQNYHKCELRKFVCLWVRIVGGSLDPDPDLGGQKTHKKIKSAEVIILF
jgi:hypothetical protein